MEKFRAHVEQVRILSLNIQNFAKLLRLSLGLKRVIVADFHQEVFTLHRFICLALYAGIHFSSQGISKDAVFFCCCFTCGKNFVMAAIDQSNFLRLKVKRLRLRSCHIKRPFIRKLVNHRAIDVLCC